MFLGKRGYEAQTGSPSWGIAWYLNDQLIPELHVERGETYTFVVEGGDKSTNPAKYHPFYITDSGRKSKCFKIIFSFLVCETKKLTFLFLI